MESKRNVTRPGESGGWKKETKQNKIKKENKKKAD